MSDWTTQAADAVEKGVILVRDKTVVPAQQGAKVVVYGFLTAFFALTAFLLVTILLFRVLVIGVPVWAAWLIIGGIFLLAARSAGHAARRRKSDVSELRELVIVGSGPAGLTAAVYAARANLRPVVIEGLGAGGQLMLTTDVENYPGFPEGIMGPDLMLRFREQAERFGAEFVTADADRVDLSGPPVHGRGRRHRVRRPGDRSSPPARRPRCWGCRTSSGCSATASPRARPATASSSASSRSRVVGGGDTAIEEAQFLTKFATKVTVVHRRDELRASKIMQDRAFANPKIEFRWNRVVEDVIGDAKLEGAAAARLGDRRRPRPRGRRPVRRDRPHPEHRALQGSARARRERLHHHRGRLDRGRRSTGVFAAGDVQDHVYRQAITAAGTGCMAAIEAERWLAEAAHAAAAH